MWRWLIVLTGCGRIGFEQLSVDASSDGQLTYRDAVLADQPLAYWRLGDTGNVATDVLGGSPGTYQGTCTHGAAGALAGDPDPAVNLGGTCLIDLGDVLAFPGTAPFSLELWLQHAATGVYGYAMMKQTRTAMAIAPIDGYAVVVGSDQNYVERIASSAGASTLDWPVRDAGFHYIIATYDGAQLAFYVDATLVHAMPDTQPLRTYSASLTLGGFSPPLSGLVIGTLDEVAIYGRALQPDRIALHHDIGVNGPR